MDWITVERGAADSSNLFQHIIYTSKEMADKLKTKTKLIFGQKEIPITVKANPAILSSTGIHFENPAIFQMSQGTIEELLLHTSATYQMYYSDSTIHIGPVIGFLLGDQHFYYHHRRMKELTDAMGVYEQVGGLFVSFRYCSIDWNDKCIFGQFFNFISQKWEYGKLPIPSVVYRRGFNSRNNFVNQFKDEFNWTVFNDVRFDKWEFYNRIKDNEYLNPIIPETVVLNLTNLITFLHRYKKVILKPKNLSRGRGISIISEKPNGWIEIHDHQLYNDFIIHQTQLEEYLRKGIYQQNEYIIQPYINLAKIDGRPWDIRVVMQKNGSNQWLCNGIECRLAPIGRMITNISNGGRALYLNEALELAFGTKVDIDQIEKEILSFSLEFCKIMDETGYHFAEFGLDLALDQQQHFWFIEANVRPAFKGFKELDKRIYQRICYEPILYSAQVAGFGREGQDENKIQHHSGPECTKLHNHTSDYGKTE
jgi:glutathione synthase/RimK-type ligase-like ATP-grasp enzyme